MLLALKDTEKTHLLAGMVLSNSPPIFCLLHLLSAFPIIILTPLVVVLLFTVLTSADRMVSSMRSDYWVHSEELFRKSSVRAQGK